MGVLGGAEAFPRYGWWGAGAIAAAVAVAQADAVWVPATASLLAWWGLALLLDGVARWRRGESVLTDAPDAFVWMAVLSIFLGVAVEWAAGRLAVWAYLGLPSNEFLRYGVQGAVFAAFLPALHGAAAMFGAPGPSETRISKVSRKAALIGLAVGGLLLAATLAAPYLDGLTAMLLAMIGLWLFCDGVNAQRGRPSLLERRRGQIRAWADAGLLLVSADALIGVISGQGRVSVQVDGPVYYAYALLAVSGPALRAAYVCLADSVGLECWPSREESIALIR